MNRNLSTPLIAGLIFLAVFYLPQCGQPSRRDIPVNRHEPHLVYTHHARCRMDCRHISETEIREILEKGEVNFSKSEPDGRPDPKYAFDGYTREGQHLRVVFAPTARGLVVITCIELGVEWACDCR